MNSQAFSLLKRLSRRKIVIVGGLVVLLMLLLAALASIIAIYDPLEQHIVDRLKGPSLKYPFGTDHLGRDVFSRAIFGIRNSLVIGAGVFFWALVLGSILGMFAGFYPVLDDIIMRFMDGLLAFPPILLAIALMASLGRSVLNVILALSIVYMPRIARILRSTVLVVRESDYAIAAEACGASNLRIMFKHVFPNCLSPVIIQGTFIFAYAVLNEAALSFLGVGLPPYIPSWGTILNEGRTYFLEAPWVMITPGVFIVVMVFGVNMLGDGLRDTLDPHLKNL